MANGNGFKGQQQQPPLISPQAGASVKYGMDGAMELSASSDIQAQVYASAMQAEMMANYALAERFPRDKDMARTELLAECKRPGFAEIAMWEKPSGGKRKKNEQTGEWEEPTISGMSIRFVETAMLCFKNMATTQDPVNETSEVRRTRVRVVDYERRVSHSRVITTNKTVERKDAKGREVKRQRMNAYNEQVFIVESTDEELNQHENNLASRTIRVLGERLLPRDLVDECRRVCEETQESDIKADPAAARKKLVDSFALMGITPVDLKAWLRHPLEQLNTKEMMELRKIYGAIRDGHATWNEVMELRQSQEKPAEQSAPSTATVDAKAETKAPEGQRVTQEEKKPGLNIKDVEEDPAEKQIREQARVAEEGVEKASTKKECAPWAEKINALPEPERSRLSAKLQARMKELK